jgi:hypothetical protein
MVSSSSHQAQESPGFSRGEDVNGAPFFVHSCRSCHGRRTARLF